MKQIWVIGDTHFGDSEIVKFRDRFRNTEEMDAHMIEVWNETVRPQDHVYHLGDIVWRRTDLHIVKKLHGHIRLVRGNHDILSTKQYLRSGIGEIHGMRVLNTDRGYVVLTHAPMHPVVVGERAFIGNIHGHLHNNPSPPGAYCNVSVERLRNYGPMTLEWAVNECVRRSGV